MSILCTSPTIKLTRSTYLCSVPERLHSPLAIKRWALNVFFNTKFISTAIDSLKYVVFNRAIHLYLFFLISQLNLFFCDISENSKNHTWHTLLCIINTYVIEPKLMETASIIQICSNFEYQLKCLLKLHHKYILFATYLFLLLTTYPFKTITGPDYVLYLLERELYYI